MKIKRRMIVNVLVGFISIVFVLTFYSTFSMNNDYKFDSLVYDIDGTYIRNVSSNTSVELYYKYFDMDNCSIEVVDDNNREIVSGFVSNGSKTVLYDNNHNVITSYINIIKGDFNGDAIIDMNDFYDMGKCLVNGCSMDEYLRISIDIDEDGEFHINDLMLLDKAITLGYEGIAISDKSIVLQSEEQSRLVVKTEPNYGINLNVNWSSTDNGIATVDDAGRVIGHKEGETIIKATTFDGKYMVESKVKVDNTIQLDSYAGVGYIGGNDVVVKIKAIDYEGITCSVSNTQIAECEIADKSLVIRSKDVGRTEIKVISPNYGEVVYVIDSYSVYLNIIPRYLCVQVGGSNLITVSGFNSGDLSFEIGDNDIIKDVYMTSYQNRNMLRIDAGTKQGRTTLKVKESNANISNMIVVDVYGFRLSDIGKATKIGEEVSTTIIGDNLGNLSCVSSDETKGICRIEGNQLIVTPLALGMITVDVYNEFSYESYNNACGQVQFIVVVQE